VYEDSGWDEQEMLHVTEALQHMLRQQEPHPAIVMDRYWNVVLTNTSAPRFFNNFVDLSARLQPRNLLHLMFDPAGMRAFIVNIVTQELRIESMFPLDETTESHHARDENSCSNSRIS
jgi:hypothetical protein